MLYLLVLILLALIGGPWLVAFALTLTGVWFTIVWIIAGILAATALIGISLVAFALFGSSIGNRHQNKSSSAFGAPLSKAFKEAHCVEAGIWKDEASYMVEVGGRTFYFRTLHEARAARDHGVEGYTPAVPVRGRLGA